MNGITLTAVEMVTFIPLLIPSLPGRNPAPLPGVKRWLASFHVGALGALIFPGIISMVGDKHWLGVAAGTSVARSPGSRSTRYSRCWWGSRSLS